MRKAGEIVTDLFRNQFGSDFMETARATAGLFSSWTQVVTEVWPCPPESEQGNADSYIPAAAVHSRIRELERGVLLVEADHPGWIQILQTKQAVLLAVVQRRFPAMGIKGIAFRLSREPIPVPEPEKKKKRDQFRAEAADDRMPAQLYHGGSRKPSEDESFYTALKGLENSIRERNKL